MDEGDRGHRTEEGRDRQRRYSKYNQRQRQPQMNRRTERCPTGNPERVRGSEGISKHGLKCHSAQGKRRPGHKRQKHSWQSECKEDVLIQTRPQNIHR